VAPLNNLHCREAIEFAVNKQTTDDAYGGPVAGGAIASTLMPPNIIGYQKFDLYNAVTQPTGDVSAAKQQLALCGQPTASAPAWPTAPTGRRRLRPLPRYRPRWLWSASN